ncbi:DUF2256 domain-containing protein [Variovorax sp. GT1P44]|uniref:DUF2256 domain-containing protein n=1 Tax=Variovorax sp. GT1P44 TaxID=3443742 RepID=UPI003F47CFC1
MVSPLKLWPTVRSGPQHAGRLAPGQSDYFEVIGNSHEARAWLRSTSRMTHPKRPFGGIRPKHRRYTARMPKSRSARLQTDPFESTRRRAPDTVPMAARQHCWPFSSKACVNCGPPLCWRRRWTRSWGQVDLCFGACRNAEAAGG